MNFKGFMYNTYWEKGNHVYLVLKLMYIQERKCEAVIIGHFQVSLKSARKCQRFRKRLFWGFFMVDNYFSYFQL